MNGFDLTACLELNLFLFLFLSRTISVVASDGRVEILSRT